MFANFMEEIVQLFMLNGLDELSILIRPGLIVCILLTILFVHFIVKILVNMFNQQQFTILLTYLINSLLIIVLVLYVVYVLDDYILLKYGLKIVLIYGLCMTFYSLFSALKSEKRSV